MAAPKKDAPLVIPQIRQQGATINLTGNTGLVCHRMSAKAKHQLMLGGRRKTAAQRLEIKHHPRDEFRASMHLCKEPYTPMDTNGAPVGPATHVVFPSMAVKSAMATAALVVAGIRKTDVQRLVFIPSEWIPVYGIPKLRMDIVRSADMNRTPDVRTRSYFETWGSIVSLLYSEPALSQHAIAALLANAGIVCGIGDFRQEKGKGSFGCFTAGGDLPEFDLAAQWDAIEFPQPANSESAELLSEYDNEVENRK